jgi:hypothetical protein
MRPEHAFFVGRSATRHFVGTAAWPADAIGTVWLRFPRLSRHRRRSWDSHPSQVYSHRRAARASPRSPVPRAVGFTPLRKYFPRPFSSRSIAPPCSSEPMSVKGGGVERSAIRDASASGLQSRLRSAAAGMKPSAAILPWAFGSSFRFAGRTSACARARQFTPSRRHQPPRPLPRPPSAHGFRRRSFPRFATTAVAASDAETTRLFALRSPRHRMRFKRAIRGYRRPLQRVEGLMPGRPDAGFARPKWAGSLFEVLAPSAERDAS